MLKEQVAEILRQEVIEYEKAWRGEPCLKPETLVDQILNLFKAEVDKLTVMDNEELVLEEIRTPTGDNIGGYPVVQVTKEIDITATLNKQLQHTKKELLDLMGE